MVHGIVKNHGGLLHFESEVGVGTTFKVFLPQAIYTPNREKGAIPSAPLGTERILYVDDERPIREMVKGILERFGYQTTIFADSVTALAQIQATPEAFDIVISDLTMPTMTGEVLARKVYEIRPDLPVIICTGYNDDTLELAKRNTAIRRILMKPITARHLAQAIRTILDS